MGFLFSKEETTPRPNPVAATTTPKPTNSPSMNKHLAEVAEKYKLKGKGKVPKQNLQTCGENQDQDCGLVVKAMSITLSTDDNKKYHLLNKENAKGACSERCDAAKDCVGYSFSYGKGNNAMTYVCIPYGKESELKEYKVPDDLPTWWMKENVDVEMYEKV